MSIHRFNQDGFTLLEVMMSAVILAMISLGVASGLSGAVRAWEAGERNLDKYQRKRIVYERLYREIAGAINVRGKSEDDERQRMIFDGQSDSLSFVTTSEAVASSGFPLSLKESYISVESGEGLKMGERLFSNRDFFNQDRGVFYVLDPNITDIQFKYFYLPRKKSDPDEAIGEGEWLDSWGPEQMEIEETVEESDTGARLKKREVKRFIPLAVEVILTAVNPKTGEIEEWTPLVIPLKEARVLGVSVKRRQKL